MEQTAQETETRDMYAILADVCGLNPRVSFKLLKFHGLFNKEILEFLFYEAGMVTLDEATGVAYDRAEKKRIWRRAKKAISAHRYYRAADILKIPQQYYMILQKRDMYITVSDAMVILGVTRTKIYETMLKLGLSLAEHSMTFDTFRILSKHFTDRIHRREISGYLGINDKQVRHILKQHGITMDKAGCISCNEWDIIKNDYGDANPDEKSQMGQSVRD